MANKVQLKRSAVPGKVPVTTDIDLGEIAINTYDGKAYIKKNVSGTESIVQLNSPGVGSSGFKNRFINGNFIIDQDNNGASISVPVSATPKYLVDQWFALSTGATITAQQIAGISEQPKSIRLTGAIANVSVTFGSRIESLNCTDLKNKTVTVSFNSKASSARTITWSAYYANGTDDFSFRALIATGTLNITTSTTAFSFSFNAGASAGNGIEIDFTILALLASETIDFDQAQIEKSSVATEFEIRSVQEELMLCQRYWEDGYLVLRGTHKNVNGQVTTTCIFKVTKRVTPTLTNTFTVSSGGTPIQRASTIYGFEYGMVVAVTDSSVMSGNWTANARL